MLEIYVNPLSTPALCVDFTANAVGADVERHVVNLAKGEHKTPDFLAINPLGKVPALRDGDLVLSESVTIMRYIAQREHSDLYPVDIQAQAKVDQWMNYVIHHLRGPYGYVQFNRMFARLLGEEPNEAVIQFGLHLLRQSLPVVERRLAESAFLAGDKFSLADIALTAALEPTELIQIDASPYPTVMAWREARRAEPWYQAVHTHFGAEIGQ